MTEIRRTPDAPPFFSVCVPQYNRTSFLLKALDSLEAQTFRDVEVCVSDDCSTDGRTEEVIARLCSGGLPFVYRRRADNGRYDANLRSALALARGRYALLLGNDDGLAAPDTLARLHLALERLGPAGLVITNYQDARTGRRYERVRAQGRLGRGPGAAVRLFRDLAFVSGLLLDTRAAQAAATDRWDGSEMYQMFIGCRLVADGAEALGLDQVTVYKDLQVPGERVESYASRPRLHPCPIEERPIPLAVMGRLVADAVGAGPGTRGQGQLAERALAQILGYTYPFWIVEYRRVQSWRYALGVCLAMRPRNIARGLTLGPLRRMRLAALYVGSTLAGLLVPVRAFRALYPTLYAVAKRRRRPAEVAA